MKAAMEKTANANISSARKYFHWTNFMLLASAIIFFIQAQKAIANESGNYSVFHTLNICVGFAVALAIKGIKAQKTRRDVHNFVDRASWTAMWTIIIGHNYGAALAIACIEIFLSTMAGNLRDAMDMKT